MGLGDEIMCTGHAREMYLADPDARLVAVRGRDQAARWHFLWDGSERMATPEQVAAGVDVQWLDNYPGRRPYLAEITRDRFVYNMDYRPPRGELYAHRGRPWRWPGLPAHYVVIEPHIKAQASPNKLWGFKRYAALVQLMASQVAFVQLGPPGTKVLPGVTHAVTEHFLDALQVLERSAGYVGAEGGLHHAAAALYKRAVVLYGGMVGLNTAYDDHINLTAGDGRTPCGSRKRCEHCVEAMAAITPAQVAAALSEIL